MALVHDHEAFPLLWYRFRGETTADDAHAYITLVTDMLERARAEDVKVFMLMDSLQTTSAGAEARRVFGEYSKQLGPEYKALTGGAVALISNALVRGAMTAIGWIAPDAVQGTKVAKDLDRGLEMLRAAAEEVGTPLDEALIQQLLSKHYTEAA